MFLVLGPFLAFNRLQYTRNVLCITFGVLNGKLYLYVLVIYLNMCYECNIYQTLMCCSNFCLCNDQDAHAHTPPIFPGSNQKSCRQALCAAPLLASRSWPIRRKGALSDRSSTKSCITLLRCSSAMPE